MALEESDIQEISAIQKVIYNFVHYLKVDTLNLKAYVVAKETKFLVFGGETWSGAVNEDWNNKCIEALKPLKINIIRTYASYL